MSVNILISQKHRITLEVEKTKKKLKQLKLQTKKILAPDLNQFPREFKKEKK